MQKSIVIAVLNQKGGVGKTTTAVNVASFLAKDGLKVLLIDSDPQANATSGVGIEKSKLETGLYDVIASNQDINKSILPTHINNLYILPTNSGLASLEVDIANEESRALKLKQAISELMDIYDYIIIDCPPALGLLTVNALSASTHVLIPVQAEFYALEGLSQLLQVMQQVQKTYNPSLVLLGVTITMFDKRNALSRQVYDEVKKHFGDKLMNTIIPRNVRLAEAPSYGQPISEYDKWSKGAKAYKNLAKEIKNKFKGN
jgi:chromosome partitioning protein